MATVYDPAQSVREAPRGPQVAAYFDLDHTLLATWSILPMLREVGVATALTPSLHPWLAKTLRGATSDVPTQRNESAGIFEMSLRMLAGVLKGRRTRWLEELGERIYREELRALVYPEMRALVDVHRECGHRIALASAATSFQAAPVARDLGIDGLVCTRFETRSGRLTGALVGAPRWGANKRAGAAEYARTHDIQLDQSFFYSDGAEDIPLLEAVGRPVATNPGPELQSVAEARGWPVLVLPRLEATSLRQHLERTLAVEWRSALQSWIGWTD